jgi:hypothetical protein
MCRDRDCLQQFVELRAQPVFFFLNAFCIGWLSWDQLLAVFAEYALYVGIESPEGMASSDFLMANQIA